MATAGLNSPPDKPAGHPSALVTLAKRFVNAIAASRITAAERELNRYQRFHHETALVHGNYRKISLSKADLLPFKS